MKITKKIFLPLFCMFLSLCIIIPQTSNIVQTQHKTFNQPLSKTTNYSPTFPVYNVKEQMTLSPIFTPDNALDVYLYWIGRANSSIYIQNPYITMFDSSLAWPSASPIVSAIVSAKTRGVSDIKIQVNQAYDSDNVTAYFQSVGIPIRWMGTSASSTNQSWLSLTHNKLMIIDGNVTLISSINFSGNAFENNRESGMVIQDQKIGQDFTNVFTSDWNDGEVPPAMLNNDQSQSFAKINSITSVTYQSPTKIPKANFTGVYNVSIFTNPDNAHDFIFNYLQSAKKSIYVSMYTISEPDFNNTLINLKRQNPSLDIRVLLSRDRLSDKLATYQAAQSLVENFIPVYNSTSNLDFYHNKYWIIDGQTTFVYSGNWAPSSVTPPTTTGTYQSGGQNRDMGIAVQNATDIASFFTNVWKQDVAAGVAWQLPAGVKQLSFKSGDVISGTVNLKAQISNLTDATFYYRWNSGNYVQEIISNGLFSTSFNTSSLPNGVNTFQVKAVNGTNQEFFDSVNVTIANYSPVNNWRVLITEVLANPSRTTDALGEFYEITNSFPFSVSLDGWSTGVKDSNFNFPAGYVLPAYTSIIFARNATGFNAAFGVNADFSYSFSLSNTASYVYLKNNKGAYVDVVAYGMTAPDGSETLTPAPSGKSLQRDPLYIDTNTTADFITATPTPKGPVPHVTLSTTANSSVSQTTTASISIEAILIPIMLLSVLTIFKRKKYF